MPAAADSRCGLSHGCSVGRAQEISILKSISYDRNIVQFYGAVLSGSEPMLVLEYMQVRSPSPASPIPLVSPTWAASPADQDTRLMLALSTSGTGLDQPRTGSS